MSFKDTILVVFIWARVPRVVMSNDIYFISIFGINCCSIVQYCWFYRQIILKTYVYHIQYLYDKEQRPPLNNIYPIHPTDTVINAMCILYRKTIEYYYICGIFVPFTVQHCKCTKSILSALANIFYLFSHRYPNALTVT